ncbi:cell division protein FtsA [Desulfotomaculum copahuensis]|uniref:SHS2 domain-containing protein n=1 Tax=Desulfotomaculum copahuensis TaxID=1838280 RepID=A0A1B7LCG7_9FIRM|nr:cell division FtsA domain-containing protein [Desulfotomaculum copahuensis]OAT80414.1 hypothetical protein A6M21_00625 [Desulfotomaculum copahuensis]
MATQKPSPANIIFALDIGTRTVIGLAAVPEDGCLRVVAQQLAEHSRRTMQDGQIHDIPGVAGVVRTVKADLEKQLGFPLNSVAIAAAGRSLITRSCRTDQEISDEEIDQPQVNALEMAAVQQAHRELADELPDDARDFTCVGYSVVSYYLDGYAISSLVGHRGKTAGVEVLATFLPGSVVNSLYAVLERVGLEPLSLTLEPIAAIEVAIPENYRLLNLALVDIGAGTADIAVTRDGAITAYGMVPVAGDEITEGIMQACLVDFDTAERMKRELIHGGEISYTDITGLEETISCTGLLERIEPALDRLAGEVAGQILAVNGGRPPRTVFCVGGGGRVPGLTEKLARRLELDAKRVVLRDRRALGEVLRVTDDRIAGPEGVTVAGIAMVALRKLGHDFIHIMVNGVEHRLFNAKEFTVANVLGLTGFNPRLLIGHNGKNLSFTLNGRPQVIYGELSRPAEILVNDRPANMQTKVGHGDRITARPAVNGADARATVAAVVPDTSFRVYITGEAVAVHGRVLVNGRPAAPEEAINSGDELELCAVRPLESWWREYTAARGEEEPARLPAFLVNGRPVNGGYHLRPEDRVTCGDDGTHPDAAGAGGSRDKKQAATDGVERGENKTRMEMSRAVAGQVKEGAGTIPDGPAGPPAAGANGRRPANIAPEAEAIKRHTANIAPRTESPAKPAGIPGLSPARRQSEKNTSDGAPLNPENNVQTGAPAGPDAGQNIITVTVNGRPVVLSGRRSYIFIDIFNHLEMDPGKIKPPVKLTLNGHAAGYMEPLQDGDAIEVGSGEK